MNGISGNSLFATKNELTPYYQRIGNKAASSIANTINNRIANEFDTLEISKEAMNKLMIRNLNKIDKIEGKIEEKYKSIKEKQELLVEANQRIDLLNKLVDNYIKSKENEPKETEKIEKPNGESGTSLEGEKYTGEEKSIIDAMKELADLLQNIEKMKAEREDKEYHYNGSLAERFNNFSIDNIFQAKTMFSLAKDLVKIEMEKLYEEIKKMNKEIKELFDLKRKGYNLPKSL